MSETPAKSTAKPAAKASSKDSGAATTAAATTSTDSGAAATSTPAKEKTKSGKDSMGGAGAVHYGFFSNVKTPEYRSGWDDIWSEKKKPAKQRERKAKEPVTVEIAFSDLPKSIQDGLADAARAELKKLRVNYDNRAKKGGVTWQLNCEVKR
jgi:hypothetical protein